MTEHDRQEIARLIALTLQSSGCVASSKCQVFDEDTAKSIKDWAKTYGNIRRFAWWSGAVIGTTILGSLAAGFLYIIYVGVRLVITGKVPLPPVAGG